MRFREIIEQPAERELDTDDESSLLLRHLLAALHAANNPNAPGANAILKAITVEPFGPFEPAKKPKAP